MIEHLSVRGVQEHLRTALRTTCDTFVREVKELPVDHWSEGVFRFYLVREMLRRDRRTDCRTEWNRVDLMLPTTHGAVMVEMKFFTTLPITDHLGNRLRWKGGPSPKNVAEYREVIEKLQGFRKAKWLSDAGGYACGYLLLAYVDRRRQGGARCYHDDYGDLRAEKAVLEIEVFADQEPIGNDCAFTCKLLRVGAG